MITPDQIQDALAVASRSEKRKIKILHKDVIDTQKACQQRYSNANFKKWQTAESDLIDFIDQVLADENGQPSGPAVSFANIPKVAEWLKRNGWKVGTSTLYKHKKTGMLRPDGSGRFPLPAVEKYAEQTLTRLDGSSPACGLDEDKRKADTRKAVAQAKHWELKTNIASGLYVPRENFEIELATRARVLKSDLLSFCRSQPAEIIDLVNGDPGLAPDLVQFMVDQVETFLDRYAADPDQANLDA